ncbi:AI-2E family transporter [Marinilabiliaceae bacterium ANBcel2]|nr:AI-2E family transporter [Marinilabiliaceae bacterium ANBcel2]
MSKISDNISGFDLISEKPYTFDRFVRLLLSIAIFIGVVIVIRSISNVLIPFFIAIILAYLVDPLVTLIQTKLRVKRRGLAVFITLMLFISIISIGLIWLIPKFLQELYKLTDLIRIYLQTHSYQDIIPENIDNWIRTIIASQNIQEFLNAENVAQISSAIVKSARSFFSGSLSILFSIVGFLLIFLYLFFILLDYKRIESGWISLIPAKHRALASAISNDLQKSMRVYFRAQSMIAMTVGVLMATGFSIINLPMAITLGIFIGILNIVPYLQIIGFFPAIALAMLKSMESDQTFLEVFLLVCLVMLIVQAIQEAVLIPKIMGKAYNMNPALIILALSVWGSLMGVLGMLLALPLTTLIVSYYKQLILKESAPPQKESSKIQSKVKEQNKESKDRDEKKENENK